MSGNTRFLASVSSVMETRRILAVGADVIDIKDPGKGALGAVKPHITSAIVRTIAGRVTTSATIGDLPMQADCIGPAMETVKATGVDIIKLGVFAETLPADILQLVRRYSGSGYRIVLVFFADLKPGLDDISRVADAGAWGVMLDTADKTRGSLRTILEDRTLHCFVKHAQDCGLLAGLAGSLGAADIAPLLKLNPDYLGFRGALCNRQLRNNSIDMQSAHNIRAMIPRLPSGSDAEQFTATI